MHVNVTVWADKCIYNFSTNPGWNITAQVTAHSHEKQVEIPNGLRVGFRLGSGLGWGYIAQSKGDL